MAFEKKPKKSQISEKTQRQMGAPLANAAEGGSSRKEINNRNRNFGKQVEREVAKLVGGVRIPGSGSIKSSNWDLKGDVTVRDADDVAFMKIECKGTSTITPKGEKQFTLQQSVAMQAFKEAVEVGQMPVLWIHFKDAAYATEDVVVIPGDPAKGEAHGAIPSSLFLRFLELVKLGIEVERKGCICDK